MTVEFRAINADREPARSLIAATLADYEKVYGDTDLGDTPSATAAEMDRPHGAFLVAYDRDRPVGCGGLKRLDADTAEIKRMYVVADARGRASAARLSSPSRKRHGDSGTGALGSTQALANRTHARCTSPPGTPRSPTTTPTRTPRTGGRSASEQPRLADGSESAPPHEPDERAALPHSASAIRSDLGLSRGFLSAPDRIRTCDLRFRRPTLYPAELRAQTG